MLVHAITLLGIVLWWNKTPALQFTWRSVTLALAWFVFSCAAITAGYHRLFSHPTYRATLPLKIFYLLFSEAGFQGSALQWSALHRLHHLFVDRDGDPYNIQRGFWFAHIGWVVRKTDPDFSRVKDLAKDPLILWQHRFDFPLGVVMTFALPTMIGMLWGEALGALLLVGFLRLAIQWHMTFCVNSVAHYWGHRDDPKSSARGSRLTALITFGEGGSHGYHHAHPGDYHTGVHWYNFDPAKWWIWLCSKVGLASNLHRVKLAND